MLDFLKEWTVNIVALALFIMVTEMLLPGGKMRKYAGLATGAVLVIAIISPLMELTGGKFNFTHSQTARSAKLEKIQLRESDKVFEEEQMSQIIEIYRENIIEQIELNVREVKGVKNAKADIIINEDRNSASFGEIKRVYIEIEVDSRDQESANERYGGGEKAGKLFAIGKVEKISVGNGKKDNAYGDVCPPEIRIDIEERMEQVFGVERENVVIALMKR